MSMRVAPPLQPVFEHCDIAESDSVPLGPAEVSRVGRYGMLLRFLRQGLAASTGRRPAGKD